MTRTTRWVDRWSILASAPFPWRICHREIVLTEVARECIDLHGRHHKSPLPAPRYCSRPRLAKSVLAVSSPASLPLSESGHFVCEFNRAHRVLPTDLTSFLDPFPCRVGIAVLASRSKEERTRDFSIFLRPATGTQVGPRSPSNKLHPRQAPARACFFVGGPSPGDLVGHTYAEVCDENLSD